MTTQRQELIRKLLMTFHLNNVERTIFKDRPVSLREISDIIRTELKFSNYFPPVAKKNSNGIFEGYFIEKVRDDEFKLLAQRHYATNPFGIAEKIEKKYSEFDKLIFDYINNEYNFTIDGLSVVK